MEYTENGAQTPHKRRVRYKGKYPKKFEEKYNAVVYHVIHSFTNIGELESYLFVSDRPDEWETDRKDLKSGQPLAWVYNYDEPDWPELGYIGVSLTTAAGLRRTW